MNDALTALINIIVAIVVCIIVEALKKAGIGKSKDTGKDYYLLISMGLGIVICVALDFGNITVMSFLKGIVSGWASNGLYDYLSTYLAGLFKKTTEVK